MTQSGKQLTIFDLSFDTKLAIVSYLDNRSLANLSKTCSYFAMLARSVVAYRMAYVDIINRQIPTLPPFINFRAGVAIGTTFYMPFMSESLLCYTFDLLAQEWSSHKLKPIDNDEIHPQVTTAAAIGHKIYLVGGRLLKSYTLSNSLIEIDTRTFTIRFVKDAQGSPPRPRHEHSVDTVDDRYLIVFGGLCYNSVGENDVFVYDSFKNTWFVPPISGQIPHLRFGHASAVIGRDFYVHGGAQIDSDSSYIIYDDLYKLDCNTWVWHKYEHPEVERYFRHQPERGTTLQKEHLIPTTGDSPHDRFQAYMCAVSGKLIIFGGHSIRVDEDDNEILCNYPLNELSIFNTRRQSWMTIHAQLLEPQNEAFLTVCNMCVGALPIDSQGVRLFVFASKKLDEHGKVTSQVEAIKKPSSESSFSSADRISSGSLSKSTLCGIAESTAQESYEGKSWEEENSKHVENATGQYSKPGNTQYADRVKEAFYITDPDFKVDGSGTSSGFGQVDGDTNNNTSNSSFKIEGSRIDQVDGASSGSNDSIESPRRPSIKPIHNDAVKTGTSSHSSYSNSSYEGYITRTRKDNKLLPCIVIIQLME